DGGAEKFKRRMVDQIMLKFSDFTKIKKGDVSSKAMQSLRAAEETLVGGGVFTKAEFKALEDILERTALDSRRANASKADIISENLSAWQRFKGAALGSEAAKISPVGSALVLTSVLKKFATGAMTFRGKETKESMELVSKLMANPSKLFNNDLIKEAVTQEEMIDALNKISVSKNRLIKSLAVTDAQAKEQENK
ncbi:MAG: hypothetical protein IZT57_04850, partial [Chloroflexi bacterium]|nr:hypothetical protein [Chloroflexota bacterium]